MHVHRHAERVDERAAGTLELARFCFFWAFSGTFLAHFCRYTAPAYAAGHFVLFFCARVCWMLIVTSNSMMFRGSTCVVPVSSRSAVNSAPLRAGATAVRQLRHFLGNHLSRISPLHVIPHVPCDVLHLAPMFIGLLIGACNPMLRPIHVFLIRHFTAMPMIMGPLVRRLSFLRRLSLRCLSLRCLSLRRLSYVVCLYVACLTLSVFTLSVLRCLSYVVCLYVVCLYVVCLTLSVLRRLSFRLGFPPFWLIFHHFIIIRAVLSCFCTERVLFS